MTRVRRAKATGSSILLTLLFSVSALAATNQLPIANAGPDRTGTPNIALTLSGSGSYDPDGTIVAYWWQFGDGGSVTTSSATVAHTYAAAGVYSPSLWVRDNAGGWSAALDVARVTIGTGTVTTTTTTPSTTTLPMGANQAPVADAGPNQSAQTLLTLTFNGSASRDPDGTIALAQWAFGDGATASGLIASHLYTAAGTYTATLQVIDNDGALDADTAVVTVLNRPPTANAGANVTSAAGVAVTLNGSASTDPDGTITTYAWTFGDGTSGSGSTPAHAYATAGSHTARLTVTDNKGATSSDTAVVTVSNAAATWAKAIGSTDSDGGYAVGGDAAGNTVVGGAYRGTVTLGGTTLHSAGGADGFVVKYSPAGTVLWARSVGGSSDDFVDGLAIDGAGDVVVAGRFTGTASFGGTALVANGSGDMVIAKYSGTNGSHQWSKRFGGTYDDAASAIAIDGSRNVYVTGYFRGTVDFGGGVLRVPYDSDLDVFLLKLTTAGAHAWSKNFPNTGNERGYGIAADAAGNVAITGSFSNTVNFGGGTLTSPNAMTDVFVARFTSAGAHTWSRRFGASDGNESGNAAAMDSNGNVLVTGTALKAIDLGGGLLSALGSADAFVAKYAATSGAHVWSRRLGGLGNDYGYGVVASPTNDVYVTGAIGGVANLGGISLTPVGSSDAFVAKYGSTGGLLWAKGLGGIDAEVGRAVGVGAGAPVAIGYFYGTGSFNGTTLSSAGTADAFVVRLAP